MTLPTKFHRTIVTYEVLSLNPINTDDLEEIHHVVTYGDCSGMFLDIIEEEVDGPTMIKLLVNQGLEPDLSLLGEQ